MQPALHLAELGELAAGGLAPALRDPEARRAAGEQLPDLAQGEAGALRGAQEGEVADDARLVAALAPRSPRLRNQPRRLVVADRRRGNARAAGDFADRQELLGPRRVGHPGTSALGA
jgi:hypothetical protein